MIVINLINNAIIHFARFQILMQVFPDQVWGSEVGGGSQLLNPHKAFWALNKVGLIVWFDFN